MLDILCFMDRECNALMDSIYLLNTFWFFKDSHREVHLDFQPSLTSLACAFKGSLVRPEVPCTLCQHYPIANSASTQTQQPVQDFQTTVSHPSTTGRQVDIAISYNDTNKERFRPFSLKMTKLGMLITQDLEEPHTTSGWAHLKDLGLT